MVTLFVNINVVYVNNIIFQPLSFVDFPFGLMCS